MPVLSVWYTVLCSRVVVSLCQSPGFKDHVTVKPFSEQLIMSDEHAHYYFFQVSFYM